MAQGMRLTMAGLLAVLASGCKGPCARLDDAAHTCGDSYDRTKCEASIDKCNSDDVKILDAYADCLEVPSTCKDGSTKDGFSKLACVVPLGHLSSACNTN